MKEVGMGVQKSKQTRIAGWQITSRHPYILHEVTDWLITDVARMSTCNLSSCYSCLFAFLYPHPYFFHNLFNCFLYLFVLFLYDCKSSSKLFSMKPIAIYSQHEVEWAIFTCISGGIMLDLHLFIFQIMLLECLHIRKWCILSHIMHVYCY